MRALFYGLGGIGQRHLRLFRELQPDAEIGAVRVKNRQFEINDSLAADNCVDLTQKYDIKTFPSTKQALDFRPDIAIVANPTSAHVTTALELLAHGIPVFVEKPLSHSMSGVNKLLRLSKDNNVPLFVGYMMRFHPAAIKLKELIEKKVVGKIYNVHVAINSYFPNWHPYESYTDLYAASKVLGGGVVLTEIHEIDLLCWYFGAPSRVASMGGTLSQLDIDVEDTASILMQNSFDSYPFFTTIQMSFVQKHLLRELTIQGEHGYLRWDISTGKINLSNHYNKLNKEWGYADVERNDLFRSQLRHIIDSIQNGSNVERGHDAIVTTQLTAMGIHRSLESGQFEKIPS